MTDRELLEAAAKAAGFKPPMPMHGPGLTWGQGWWNPLIDSGEALELAVKLNLGISIPVHQTIRADVVCFRDSSVNVREEGNDPYAATRLAIVRAAAEIGGKE